MTGLAALGFNFIPMLGELLGYGLTWLIKVLNYLVFWVESWPYSLIENIFISSWQALILGMLVLVFCFYLEQRKVKYLALAGASLICFSLCSWQHFSTEVVGKRLTVYRVPGQSVYDLSDSGTAFTFSSARDTSDKRQQDFNLRPNRLTHGIDNIVQSDACAFTKRIHGGILTVWGNVTIFNVVEKDFILPPDVKINYLIISRNSARLLDNVWEKGNIEWIIIDSSNSRTLATALLEQAKLIPRQRIHSVWHQGAFEVKL
jgi:competence protein ComEC